MSVCLICMSDLCERGGLDFRLDTFSCALWLELIARGLGEFFCQSTQGRCEWPTCVGVPPPGPTPHSRIFRNPSWLRNDPKVNLHPSKYSIGHSRFLLPN